MPTIQVMFNQQKLANYVLDKEVYTIGRQEGCDIHIDNLGVSRVHARLLKDGDGYLVEDMNSSNGTFVNGQRVVRQHIKPGDQIAIGKFILVYEMSAAQTAQEFPGMPSDSGRKPLPPLPGDMLGTMQMDAETIRKRIDEMQRKKQEEALAPAAVSARPPTAAVPSQPPASGATIKAVIVILAVAVAALLAAVVYLLAKR